MDRHLVAAAAVLIAVACASPPPPPPDETPAGEALLYDGPLQVTSDPLRIPDTFVGCARSSVLRLDNASADTSVRVDRIETRNDSLRVSGALPLEIPAGERRFVDLHFLPDEPGDESGSIEIVTAEAPRTPIRLEALAVAIARPPAPDDPGPLDLVVVLDVSTTMGTMPRLRQAIGEFFDFIQQRDGDVRIGLTSFVNDVHLHREAAFLDREALFQELDSQLDPDTGTPNFDLPRHQLNFDFAENSLGALFRSATEFPFRREARRVLLLITDDTFLEPPAVFSDGIPARVSYAQVADALAERGIQLVSVHASARGRGLSSNADGATSLVNQTGGSWHEFADVTSNEHGLGTLLTDLASGRSCD